jgi:acetylornithine deacetylase/succinyl-diaminopimelate desuccinylase-like protein
MLLEIAMSLASLLSRLAGETSIPALEHEAFQEACLAQTCHVVDVREPHEYAAGHIPHAQNHPLSSFDPAQLPTGKPVVLVYGHLDLQPADEPDWRTDPHGSQADQLGVRRPSRRRSVAYGNNQPSNRPAIYSTSD